MGLMICTLDSLNKGCTCKTGCKTKRCSCVKKERKCGAGCECKGCVNVQLSHPSQETLISVEDDNDNVDSDNGSAEESEQSDEEELQTQTFFMRKRTNVCQCIKSMYFKKICHLLFNFG